MKEEFIPKLKKGSPFLYIKCISYIVNTVISNNIESQRASAQTAMVLILFFRAEWPARSRKIIDIYHFDNVLAKQNSALLWQYFEISWFPPGFHLMNMINFNPNMDKELHVK